MKNILVLTCIAMLFAAPAAYSAQAVNTAQAAQRFVELLHKGDYGSAVKDFDKKMTEVCPPDKLKAIWNSLLEQFGPFIKQLKTEQLQGQQGYDIFVVNCKFTKSDCGLKVVFNQSRQVSGFFFVPPAHPNGKK